MTYCGICSQPLLLIAKNAEGLHIPVQILTYTVNVLVDSYLHSQCLVYSYLHSQCPSRFLPTQLVPWQILTYTVSALVDSNLHSQCPSRFLPTQLVPWQILTYTISALNRFLRTHLVLIDSTFTQMQGHSTFVQTQALLQQIFLPTQLLP